MAASLWYRVFADRQDREPASDVLELRARPLKEIGEERLNRYQGGFPKLDRSINKAALPRFIEGKNRPVGMASRPGPKLHLSGALHILHCESASLAVHTTSPL